MLQNPLAASLRLAASLAALLLAGAGTSGGVERGMLLCQVRMLSLALRKLLLKVNQRQQQQQPESVMAATVFGPL